MIKRKDVFNERKRRQKDDEYTGLRLPRGVNFDALPRAIVDGVFMAKPGDRVAFDYPIELGQKVMCVGTVFPGPGDDKGAVYIWNETMGNRVYSFKLPEASAWVCDVRLLLDEASTEVGAGRKRRRRKNSLVEQVTPESDFDLHENVVVEETDVSDDLELSDIVSQGIET